MSAADQTMDKAVSKLREHFGKKHDVTVKKYPGGKRVEKWSGLYRPSHVIHLNGQNFHLIRAQCLKKGEPWQDPTFPATDASLYYQEKPQVDLVWKRPKDIVENPVFFGKQGPSRFNVKQGGLGDCWFLASIASLTLEPRLLKQTVPDDQSFDGDTGVFHFRFWHHGRWVDVVVDDRLPTYQNELYYVKPMDENVFWSALLEKAYAKLHGCYEALKGGEPSEATVDFTGGVTESFMPLNKAPKNLFEILLASYERHSLLDAFIVPPEDGIVDPRPAERMGLPTGHAYSITKVVQLEDGQRLVRVRNPWGQETEWTGAWSDKSAEWATVLDKIKEKLEFVVRADGEFWITYDDLLNYFDAVQICHVSPNYLAGTNNKHWQMSMIRGEWVKGVTAGGGTKSSDTFQCNPQFVFTVKSDTAGDNRKETAVLIGLMQLKNRERRQLGKDMLNISFFVYKLYNIEQLSKPVDGSYFMDYPAEFYPNDFTNSREVCFRVSLTPGVYCIIPITQGADEESEFLIRVFSDKDVHLEERDVEIALEEIDIVDDGKVEKIQEVLADVMRDEKQLDWTDINQLLSAVLDPEGKERDDLYNDLSHSLVAMMGSDSCRQVDADQFPHLISLVLHWQNVYKKYTASKGTWFGLRSALRECGVRVNNRVLNLLGHRYMSQGTAPTLGDWLQCVARVRNIIECYKAKFPEEEGKPALTLQEFVEFALSL